MARTTKSHRLKTTPHYFEAVFNGSKRFEVRKDDGRGFGPGDKLTLEEFNPESRGYTGRKWKGTIGRYVLSGVQGLEPGFVVFETVETPKLRPEPEPEPEPEAEAMTLDRVVGDDGAAP